MRTPQPSPGNSARARGAGFPRGRFELFWALLPLLLAATPACTRARALGSGGAQEGMASFYGRYHHGRKTASGEPFDMNALTAAHRTFPFGTCLDVENVGNGRRVRVRVNDRGPYAKNRVVDLSQAAAERLGMVSQGVARVRLRRCE